MNKTFSKGMAIAPLLVMGAAGVTSANALDSTATVDDTSNPVSSVSAQSTTGDSAQTDLASAREQILAETNAVRAEAGLAPVKLSESLNSIAQSCSEEQAANQQMAHCTGFYDKYPAGWTTASENVAYGYSLDQVTEAWRNSSGHYANMVDSKATHLGIGIAYDSTGTPYYTQNYAGYESDPDGDNSSPDSSTDNTSTDSTTTVDNTATTDTSDVTDTATEQDSTVTDATDDTAVDTTDTATEQDSTDTTDQTTDDWAQWDSWDQEDSWNSWDDSYWWDYSWDWWQDSADAGYDYYGGQENAGWHGDHGSSVEGDYSSGWAQWGSWPSCA